MSTYSCPLAGQIGHEYRLAPEQVWPEFLRTLSRTWHPRGRDLTRELNTAADSLDAELAHLGLPRGRPACGNEDGRAMARQVLAGVPGTAQLLAELERGWACS